MKKHLLDVLEHFLNPIQKRRALFAKDRSQVMDLIKNGSEKAEAEAEKTMKLVKKAMKIDY